MKREAVVYLVAEGVAKVIPFLLIPFFTYRLGVAAYGELNLFQVFQNLFVILISLGGDTLLTRVKFRYSSKVFDDCSLLFVVLCFLAFLILFPLVFLFGDVLLLFSLSCALMCCMNNALLIRFQVYSIARHYALMQFGLAVVSTVLTFILFDFLFSDYRARAVAVLVGYCFSLSIGCALAGRLALSRLSYKRIAIYLKMFFMSGVAMLFHKLSFFCRGQLDRIFVSEYHSVEDLSLYSLASQIVSVVTVIFTAVNMALYPIIYARLRGNAIAVIKKVDVAIPIMLFLCFFSTALVFIVPSSVYGFLFGDGFSGIGDYVWILFFAFSVQSIYLVLSTIAIYFEKNALLAIGTVLAGVGHVLGVLIVAPTGVSHLPYVAVASNIFVVVYLVLFVYRPIRHMVGGRFGL